MYILLISLFIIKHQRYKFQISQGILLGTQAWVKCRKFTYFICVVFFNISEICYYLYIILIN